MQRDADKVIMTQINREQLIAMIQLQPAACVLLDSIGNILAANEGFAQLAQHAKEELTEQPIRNLLADKASQLQIDFLLSDDARHCEGELTLRSPDGQSISTICTGGPVDSPQGERLLCLIGNDEQKHAYDHIAKLTDTVLDQAVQIKRYSESLEHKVTERTAQLHQANMDAIYMLAIASEARDEDTGSHVRRIEHAAAGVASKLGMDDPTARRIGYSAILHDVGKIHVPDGILKKPGPLDDEEFRLIQKHTTIGESILARTAFFELARIIARSHHENFDGSGYPDGMAGTEIPIEARIVRVVDVFDALTHTRVYKPAYPHEQAFDIMQESVGRHFDPEVIDAFHAWYRETKEEPKPYEPA